MLRTLVFVGSVIAVVYPVVTTILLGIESLGLGLSTPARTALLSVMMVPAMTLWIVPRIRAAVDRRFG